MAPELAAAKRLSRDHSGQEAASKPGAPEPALLPSSASSGIVKHFSRRKGSQNEAAISFALAERSACAWFDHQGRPLSS
jgi:hypothetical protein